MKRLRRVIRHPNFWPLVIVVLVGLLAGKGLFGPGYFNMHDDLQMMRQLEMEKCFLDLQIPCRWVPDMGYGFGFPLFNYYPPLPYLVGEIFRLVGVSFVDTAKDLFILSFVASGITMYFFAKSFFGKFGGILSSIFYIWAPYHSVDVYVRGAMNEAWALIWFPAILLASYNLIFKEKDYKRWLIILSLSWFGLLVSHNLMVLIFTPVFGVWCLIWIVKSKSWKKIVPLGVSGVFAFCLAAFFTLPVFVEQSLVQTNTLVRGYYEFTAHFVTLKQLLFSRFWGYGPSIWGDNDGMSFQIGHLHWILSLVIAGIIIYRFIKYKKLDSVSLAIGYLLVIGWIAAFMTHSRSTFIWLQFPLLKFVQFPWRFLTIVILSFSFAVGYLSTLLNKKVVIILVLALIIFNWNYFLPEHGHLGPLTDSQKFSGAAWGLQQNAGILDYLPVAAEDAPKMAQKYLAEISRGKAEITNSYQGTNWGKFDINVSSDVAEVRIGIFQFPDWRIFVDGKEVASFIDKDEKWGRMYVSVSQGQHHVELRLYNTPIRTIGNIVSLVSWIGLGMYLMVQFKRGGNRTRTP